jgi:hypothetical protein
MLEHLTHAEFVLGLVEKLLIFFAFDGHDLERVLSAVALAANLQNRAVRALAERTEDLKFPDCAMLRHAASMG